MGRIIYLVPHPKSLISGGVKFAYRHVELLEELGYDAVVFQPEGRPAWLASAAKVLTAPPQTIAPDDVIVFPENAAGWVADMVRSRLPARNVLLCQNQHYMFYSAIPAETYGRIDFATVAATSGIAARFLANVFGFRDIAVLPYFIDPALFYPRPKKLQIAYIPHKLPREAKLIRTMFELKYPRLESVPLVPIEGASEAETARIIGESAIFLSLALHESFGLPPLEAMASRTLVAGFDGYGGKEYATPKNGYWYEPDDLESVADRLAAAVDAIARADPEIDAMLDAGAETAQRYHRSNTAAALNAFYGALVARRAGA